jgi:hypothetical protein
MRQRGLPLPPIINPDSDAGHVRESAGRGLCSICSMQGGVLQTLHANRGSATVPPVRPPIQDHGIPIC